MKSVVIHSGGLDSTVLLYQAVKYEGADDVYALSFDYGQRHRVELEYAEWHQVKLRVKHDCIDLSDLRKVLSGSSQIDSRIEVPQGHYAEDTMKQTVVPNRNMIMISIATAAALSTGAGIVMYGAHAGDHTIYPDCRMDFIWPLSQAIMQADWKKVHLHAPFIHKSKADIVKEGVELGVPFAFTWSCYRGQTNPSNPNFHCGRCGTCVERLEAFDLVSTTDPAEYEDREFYKEVIAERKRKDEERS